MKVKTAVGRIEAAINAGQYIEADRMLQQYRRKFGNRKFTYWIRTHIANGLWQIGIE